MACKNQSLWEPIALPQESVERFEGKGRKNDDCTFARTEDLDGLSPASASPVFHEAPLELPSLF